MKLSIKKSRRYVPKGVDIKDIHLGGWRIGVIYPVEGEDYRGIYQITNNEECKRNGWSETPDGYAVELEDSIVLNEVFEVLCGRRNYDGTNFFWGDRKPVITIFPTLREARKFARDSFGTHTKLRSHLVEIILTEMRGRADYHNQKYK